MTELQLLMLGLPESGKTSFLASLYGVAEEGGCAGDVSVEFGDLDLSYLNSIRGEWLSCEPLERTKPNQRKVAKIRFSKADTPTVELTVPDLAGELFETHFAGRSWSPEFDEQAQGMDGLLLFIPPSAARPGRLIEEGDAIVGSDDNAGQEKGVAFSPSKVPPPVRIIDLLQAVMMRRSHRALRVAAVVSAWDVVQDQNLSPSAWIRARLPLLWQFLEACPDLTVRYFGLSAQGGDYRDAKEDLLKTPPLERPILVDEANETTSNDVTVPVLWMLED